MIAKKTPSPSVKKGQVLDENNNPEHIATLSSHNQDKVAYRQSILFSPLQNEHDEYQSNFKFEMVPIPEGT